MEHKTRLSRLMHLSWDIQKKKRCSRAKSLSAAWAITQHEDITIYYLVNRYSAKQANAKKYTQRLALFQAQ